MRLILMALVFLSFSIQAQQDSKPVKVCVAGKCESGDVARKDINRSAGVLILEEDKNKLEALSFDAHFTIKGQKHSYHNEGYMFTKECKSYIAQLHPGDSMELKAIEYKLGDGEAKAEDRRYMVSD